MQLPYNRVTFSQTCLFLDRIFDKFRLPREPRLLITSFANLIIKLSVIKSPWRFISEQKEVKCATNTWNLLMIVQEKKINGSSKNKLVCKNAVT